MNKTGRRLFFIIGIMSVLVFVMLSCSPKTFQSRWEEMSQKEKTVWMLDTYNDQYDDYMLTLGYVKNEDDQWMKVSNPIFSEEKADILKRKKEILTSVYPIIMTYDALISDGGVPSIETEREILKLLEELLLML